MTAFHHEMAGYRVPNGVGAGFSPKMPLSPHFRLIEFTRSQTAEKYDLHNVPRDEAEIANLRALAVRVLEPVRAIFGKYVVITSGFRCTTLNRLIGGAAGSQHMLGEAADFIVRDVPVQTVAEAIALSDIPFDQLIYETRRFGGRLTEWVHISHRRLGPNRGEVLSIHRAGGATQTLKGVQAPVEHGANNASEQPNALVPASDMDGAPTANADPQGEM